MKSENKSNILPISHATVTSFDFGSRNVIKNKIHFFFAKQGNTRIVPVRCYGQYNFSVLVLDKSQEASLEKCRHGPMFIQMLL
jgi:hypothetical protein